MSDETKESELYKRVWILESDFSKLNESHIELKDATVALHREMSTLVRSVDSLTTSISYLKDSLDKTEKLRTQVGGMKGRTDTIPKLWEHVDELRIKNSTNSVIISAVKVVAYAVVVAGTGIALAYLFGGSGG